MVLKYLLTNVYVIFSIYVSVVHSKNNKIESSSTSCKINMCNKNKYDKEPDQTKRQNKNSFNPICDEKKNAFLLISIKEWVL